MNNLSRTEHFYIPKKMLDEPMYPQTPNNSFSKLETIKEETPEQVLLEEEMCALDHKRLKAAFEGDQKAKELYSKCLEALKALRKDMDFHK